MSSSSTIFTGSSRYSSDFQQVIERAVSIASLPLSILKNQESAMNDQSTALTGLQTKFTALQKSLTDLATSGGASSYSATSSDSTVATATVTGSALAGEYTIDVLNPGSYAVTLSKEGLTTVTDPSTGNIASGTSFTLSISGVDHTIEASSGTLNSLADAVNASGLGVRATIVNLGSGSSPDYRLSIQGDHYAAMDIQLSSGSTSLIDSVSTGAAVEYRVNGAPSTSISSGSRTVTLAPGVTANLSKIGSTTLQIAQSTSSIEDALSAFATAYNDTIDSIDAQRGSNDGALSGQSILLSLSSSLRSLNQYETTTGSAIGTLTQLGFSLDKTGHLTFSSDDFQTATGGDAKKAIAFLGSSTSSGFLKFATDALNGVNDSDTGSLSSAISTLTTQITEQDDKISKKETEIEDLRVRLNEQMAAADAAIASLEQQVTYITGLFEAMKSNQSSN